MTFYNSSTFLLLLGLRHYQKSVLVIRFEFSYEATSQLLRLLSFRCTNCDHMSLSNSVTAGELLRCGLWVVVNCGEGVVEEALGTTHSTHSWNSINLFAGQCAKG